MKPILDACCGGKMFYFDKNDPRVLFQDIRKEETTLCDGRKFEVAPDVVGDFTSMRFPDNTFNMVVFDPPHLRWWGKDKEKQPTGFQGIKYGTLRSDWRETLAKGFAECFRVLMPGGFLIFKWNETDIRVSEVLKLTDQKPIFGHKSGKRANTHWICFMKEEKQWQYQQQNNLPSLWSRKSSPTRSNAGLHPTTQSVQSCIKQSMMPYPRSLQRDV